MSLISGDEAKFPPGCMDNRQMPVGCRGAGVAASNLSEQSNKTRGIKNDFESNLSIDNCDSFRRRTFILYPISKS